MIWWLLIGGGTLWALTRGGGSATSIVVLGDSLAVGLTPIIKAWAKENNLDFASDAKGGRSTRAQKVDVVTPGSIVLVSLGTNDAVAGDIDYIKSRNRERIVALADAIRRKGAARIIWLVPPATRPLPGLPVVKKAIAEIGVETVTVSTPLRDGIHPSNYKIVAAAMVNQIKA